MSTSDIRRVRAIRRVLIIELGCNILVAAAKAAIGLWTGSLAVLADSVHSLVDGGANVIGFVLIGVAGSPPDSSHPYGHRKIEVIAAAILGLLVAGTATTFGVDAVRALANGRPPPTVHGIGMIAIVGTLGVNIFVALYERRKARELGSAYLAADAAHTASDVAVTIFVLVAYGATKLGFEWADPVGALVVLVVVLRVAWGILAANLSVLVDAAAVDPDLVIATALEHPEVKDCHRVRSRGPADAIQVDLHLVMAPELSLERAHDIAHEVEDRLRVEISGLVDVTVHLEPEGHDPEPL